MVLEAVLYFVLGFFTAGLLVLMISPTIWNRAVLLTKQKIESSVPLNLNEIQAEKDQLRAEFAMNTRRLEISIDELREKTSEQLIEINRKREEAAKFEFDATKQLARISELELIEADLKSKLEAREFEVKELNAKQAKLEEQYAATSEDLGKARKRLSDSEEELAGKRIELVARDSKISSLTDTIELGSADEDEKIAKVQELRLKLANAEETLMAEKRRAEKAEEAALQAQEEAKNAGSKLDEYERDQSEKRLSNSEDSSKIMDLNEQLISEKTKIVELEAKLAKLAIQSETASAEPKIVPSNEPQSEPTSNVENLGSEKDAFKKELAAIKADASGNHPDQPAENAILRERIADVAAQVAAMTAKSEGKSSPINKLLEKEPKAKKRGSKSGKLKTKNPTLAEKIRAVQSAANSSN